MPRKLSSIVTTSFLFVAIPALAGDLNPPVGPVAPTHKTLTEVEPRTAINDVNTPGDANSIYRISSPGTYYLTQDVAGATSMHGIEIASSNVTIDLNGFSLINAAPGSFDGITASIANQKIVIRNGYVEGWSGRGIDLSLSQVRDTRIEDIVAKSNSDDGIHAGAYSIIIRCQAISNGGAGIDAYSNATIRDCESSGNDGRGISANDGANISGCIVNGNAGDGIGAGSGAVFENCVARSCEGDGFTAGLGALIRDCVARQNDTNGIDVGAGSLVESCLAQFNSATGIVLDSSSTVSNCNSYANTGAGIVLNWQSQALNNTCNNNGNNGTGAGIHALGNYNRIEANHCINNDTGFDIDGIGNLVVKNSAKLNTVQFDIVASNDVGTIVVSPAGAGPWDNLQF